VVPDEATAATLRQDPNKLFRARCWAELNQGLVRGGAARLAEAHAEEFKRQWKALNFESDNLKTGSCLLLSDEQRANPDLDMHRKEREEWKEKYGWCFGYLAKRHDDLIGQLQELDHAAPAAKVLPFAKPSEELAARQNLFSKHLKEVQRVEDALVDTMSKLTQWNTYFGLDQFGREVEVEAPMLGLDGQPITGGEDGASVGGSVGSGTGGSATGGSATGSASGAK